MSIQILPAQLANQIAAGEVVERPASVVKELIENSLDAGATRIDVDIDKGGIKRILIRDNGKGIAHEQLTLALSRHATSKIKDINDLEHIATLGFRGEALASISSVARLSLSSRPEHQEQAWLAQAFGRDMAVELKPTSHPIGSSVEVLDLFFNTPARRKFLRTEKTEFAHIDELLKRLALSRFDVQLSLKHNGKQVRHYRIANDEQARLRRLSAAMGHGFTQHCLAIDNQHDQLRLHGWLGGSEAARGQSDHQYFYVNGRMMRDKLITHAIRQSFAPYIDEALFPSYVLYLDLPANQVDVNVHPAKHEVRFHQARLVHDYIVRVLSTCLQQQSAIPMSDELNAVDEHGEYMPSQHAALATSASSAASPRSYVAHGASELRGVSHDYRSNLRSTREASEPRVNEQGAYQHWLSESSQFARTQHESSPLNVEIPSSKVSASSSAQSKPLLLLQSQYLLVSEGEVLQLWHMKAAQRALWQTQLSAQWQQGVERVPLLLPLQLPLSGELQAFAQTHEKDLQRLGFVMRAQQGRWVLSEVPKLLRRVDFARLLPNFLALMQLQNPQQYASTGFLCALLIESLPSDESAFELPQAQQIYFQLQSLALGEEMKKLWRPVDLTECIKGFENAD